MIIFKDLITGDELFSDIYPMEVVDGIFYKVKGKYVSEKVGEIDEALLGANASAEGGDESKAEASVNSGVNIVLAGRLVETGFKKKKDYQVCLKEYMARIVEKLKENNPDRVEPFKKDVQAAMKKIFEKFSDCQFFLGESCDTDGMHVIMIYEDETPYVYFFKDGLIEEKV